MNTYLYPDHLDETEGQEAIDEAIDREIDQAREDELFPWECDK